MIKIIIGVILLVVILFAFYSIYNNKFQLSIIKLEKGEEDIDIYLEKKHDLLVRVKTLISKEIKKEEIFTDLDDSYEQLNHFDKHDLLKKLYNELFKIIDDHEKLLKSDNITSILEELNTNEENIVGAIKFYNDTVVAYSVYYAEKLKIKCSQGNMGILSLMQQ